MDADLDLDKLVGQTLAGRYRVLRPIGSGGMGAVFEAEQVDIGRRVALKVLFSLEPRAVARFRQEALAAAKLRSPNVVAVTDFVEPPDAPPFLVMDLLDGESLASLLARAGKVPPEQAVEIATQVLAGLADAHANGIIHRDVKPGNIFLVRSPGGRHVVKLLDFGIAKLADGGVRTTTGAIVGTRSYLAPEQIVGRWPVGPATDLHAVGLVLYEMIAGARPWAASKDVIASIAYEPAPPLGDAPPRVAEVVARALAKTPQERFASAEAMIAALGASATPKRAEPVPAAPPPAAVRAPSPTAPTASSRRPLAFFAVAFLVTAALVGAGIVAAARFAAARAEQVTTSPPPDTSPTIAEPARPDVLTPDAEPEAIVDASAPETSPIANVRLPKLPAGPLLDGDCVCFAQRAGNATELLCQTPQTPVCSCQEIVHHEYLCPSKWAPSESGAGTCVDGIHTFGGPGKKNDDACIGYQKTYIDSGSFVAPGRLSCQICEKVAKGQGVPGIHGQPCKGYATYGKVLEGTWECLVRRR